MGGTKGAKTEPRRLHPLLVRDADGSAIEWNLQARLQVGEALPPLNRDGDGSQALNQYLRRRKIWMQLREDAEQLGEQLTPYSFRHRYAKAMHAANIPIANISEAMGHTIEVHLKSYARFKPDATAANFAAVNVSYTLLSRASKRFRTSFIKPLVRGVSVYSDRSTPLLST